MFITIDNIFCDIVYPAMKRNGLTLYIDFALKTVISSMISIMFDVIPKKLEYVQ